MEAVEDITSNIQAAQAAVTAAPPLAAKPGQLREQLEASKYILDDMENKVGDLESMKADANKMIDEAGVTEDHSVRGQY